MMKTLFICVVLLLSAISQATGLKTESETRALCDQAAKQFGGGHYKTSFNSLKSHWPLPEEELTNLIYKTESQLQMTGSRFGELLGADYINTQKVGRTFIKHTYVIKLQNHALRYMCVLYKPKNVWLVNSIKWDDEISLLFD